MMIVRSAVVVGASVGAALLAATPAEAAHDHFLVTPNGQCHQVAQGQTGIADAEHGGFHRYHANVHLAGTEGLSAPDALGDGRSRVNVYKDACPS